MSALEVMRHLSVFSPHAFGNKRVDVVGAGATGSRIVFSLAKLGVANIHVWDFDKVEEHNIPNQVFSLSDIGKFKGEALKEIVAAEAGEMQNIPDNNIRVAITKWLK